LQQDFFPLEQQFFLLTLGEKKIFLQCDFFLLLVEKYLAPKKNLAARIKLLFQEKIF